MKIATKYILQEFIPTLLIAFMFFFMMFMVNHILVIIKPLIEKSIPGSLVMWMLISMIPLYTMFTLPFSILLATLMTVGRFSSDNEVVAFRSLGFNMMQIFGPLFTVGLIIAVTAFFINDRLRPLGMRKQIETRKKIARIKPTIHFKSKTVKKYANTGKTIYTNTVSEKKIDGLIIIDRDNDGQKRIITSKEARFITHKGDSEAMEIRMNDAMLQFENTNRPNEFNFGYSKILSYFIKFRDFDTSASTTASSEVKTLRQILGDVRKHRKVHIQELANRNNEYLKKLTSLDNEINILSNYNRWNFSSSTIKSSLKKMDNSLTSLTNINKTERKNFSLNSSYLDFWDRFALPLACIIFVIFAAPIGIFSKRAGYAFGFIIGLFLCSVYWFSYYSMIIMGKKMVLPPFLATFIPNLAFLVVGVIFLIKRMRE